MALPDQDLIELVKSSELIKWMWGILLIPITLIGRLIWNNHMKTHDIEVALEKQSAHFEVTLEKQNAYVEGLLHEHQQWVSKNHPTIKHFDQRMEDMITPVQLSVLETRQDIKSILAHIIKDKK